MKINSMFFIAMCGLCISCGAEITTDTSSEILSDRQIPIGISTVAVPEYGAETTRGLIANATYQLGLFRTGDKVTLLSMMRLIRIQQPDGRLLQK